VGAACRQNISVYGNSSIAVEKSAIIGLQKDRKVKSNKRKKHKNPPKQ
jgi:hypothetical protein